MYADQIIEKVSVSQILNKPAHPYTSRLIKCVPVLGQWKKKLNVIKGMAPMTNCLPVGCTFVDRCEFVEKRCRFKPIILDEVELNHHVRCIKPLKDIHD